MAVWIIAKTEGSGTVCEWEKSAPQTEIRAILQQLASRHLSEDEVVEQGKSLLEVQDRRGGRRPGLECGHGTFYYAYRKSSGQ